MERDSKIVVVMPAYNAAKTLSSTYKNIPMEIIDEVIMVDDASIDDTVKVAMRLNLKLVLHPHNVGY